MSVRDTWRTPQDLFDKLNSEFRFSWDLAASSDNAKCARFFDEEQDSLAQDWASLEGWLWCNPPFSQLDAWTAKAAEESERGAKVVMLLPAHRVEQAWFHDNVIGCAAEIRLPRGRVKYEAPEGIKTSSPTFPSMVVVYTGLRGPTWLMAG